MLRATHIYMDINNFDANMFKDDTCIELLYNIQDYMIRYNGDLLKADDLKVIVTACTNAIISIGCNGNHALTYLLCPIKSCNKGSATGLLCVEQVIKNFIKDKASTAYLIRAYYDMKWDSLAYNIECAGFRS
jgi:hypothetical protein